MGYAEELEPLVEALEAAGYVDARDPNEGPYLLWMKKQLGDRVITIMADGGSGKAGVGMPIRLMLVNKSVDINLRISPADASDSFDTIITNLEAELLATE